MRIAHYRAHGESRIGVVSDERIIDLADLDEGLPLDVAAILSAGPAAWSRLCAAASQRSGHPLLNVQLLAPVPRPAKFLAVGMNSHDHVEEARHAPRTPELLAMLKASEHLQLAFPEPRFPLLFNKQTNSITGPYDPIWIPRDSDQVDYEGEVAVVIGKRLRRADETAAARAIAGWTVTNDVSVRDWQWNTSQTWLGKSFDTHGPIGPWIVTADEFEPADAVIRTWVNGEQRQEGRLADQILPPAKIVAMISQVCTLEPGDLIATGTPGGIGGLTGSYLAPGDRVRVEISGIGAIENPVIAEPLEGRETQQHADVTSVAS
jgi:2-keto-4-pentenoate hydratase/2-oxohepta-3-ene-1,7-dioic acid hydratase in catechol pathway